MGRIRRLRRHPAKKCLMRLTYQAYGARCCGSDQALAPPSGEEMPDAFPYQAYGVRCCRPDKALAPPSGEEMPDAFHLSGLRGTLL